MVGEAHVVKRIEARREVVAGCCDRRERVGEPVYPARWPRDAELQAERVSERAAVAAQQRVRRSIPLSIVRGVVPSSSESVLSEVAVFERCLYDFHDILP